MVYKKLFGLSIAIFVFVISVGSIGSAQSVVKKESAEIWIQPQPKKMVYSGFTVTYIKKNNVIPVYLSGHEEKKAANYLKKTLNDQFPDYFDIQIVNHKYDVENTFHIMFKISPNDQAFNDQFYSLNYEQQTNSLTISSPGLPGLLYGVVSFSQCMFRSGDMIEIPLFNISEWAELSDYAEKYHIKIVGNFQSLGILKKSSLIRNTRLWEKQNACSHRFVRKVLNSFRKSMKKWCRFFLLHTLM